MRTLDFLFFKVRPLLFEANWNPTIFLSVSVIKPKASILNQQGNEIIFKTSQMNDGASV